MRKFIVLMRTKIFYILKVGLFGVTLKKTDKFLNNYKMSLKSLPWKSWFKKLWSNHNLVHMYFKEVLFFFINQQQNIFFKYHLRVRTNYFQSQMIELSTHVGHYKHEKQEKKI